MTVAFFTPFFDFMGLYACCAFVWFFSASTHIVLMLKCREKEVVMTACCFPPKEDLPTIEIKVEDSCNCCMPPKRHQKQASESTTKKVVSIATNNIPNVDPTVPKPIKSVRTHVKKKSLTRSPSFHLDRGEGRIPNTGTSSDKNIRTRESLPD